jgi:hypothetical protein
MTAAAVVVVVVVAAVVVVKGEGEEKEVSYPDREDATALPSASIVVVVVAVVGLPGVAVAVGDQATIAPESQRRMGNETRQLQR